MIKIDFIAIKYCIKYHTLHHNMNYDDIKQFCQNQYNQKKSHLVYTSFKTENWYKFQGHKWVLTLTKTIIDESLKEYIDELQKQLTYTLSLPDSDQKTFDCFRLNRCLKYGVNSDQTIKLITNELKCFFLDLTFIEKLDANTNLLGFTNGVYDLMLGQLRDGQPDDYISIGADWEFAISHDCECQKFISEIFPNNPQVRDYIVKELSSYLNESDDKPFCIWTGNGDNSKKLL